MTTTKKSSPVAKVHTGRAGRPADVRKKAERVMRSVLFDGLSNSLLVAQAVPGKYIANKSTLLADSIWHALHAAGLRIVPARFLSEIAVFSGEPVAADDPSLPKVINPETAAHHHP